MTTDRRMRPPEKPRQRVHAVFVAVLALLAASGLTGDTCTGGLTSKITVDFTKNVRAVPPFLFGQNLETIENGEQVIAADGTLDGEIVQVLTDARISMLRYPGGAPADHFIWWQALGPPSRRALQGSGNKDELYRPFVGPQEFIDLAKALRAVPFITANTGSGSAALAGAFAQYFNSVGFPVTYWEIGNEPYFNGINDSGVLGLTPDVYGKRVIEFASAIRSQVPNAKIFAAGVIGPADDASYWNGVMLGIAGPYIDGISLHTYAPLYAYTPGPNPTPLPEPAMYAAMLGATKAFERTLGVVVTELTRSGRLIPIFVTEYDGTFFADESVEPSETTLARNPTLACALYNASILQVMMRSERVQGAHHMSLAGRHYGSLVGVDGSVRFRNPQFYVQREYARQAGDIVVQSTLDPKGSTFDTQAVREIPGQTAVPMLDAVATRDAAGREYALFVVNRSLASSVSTTIETTLPATAAGTRSVLTGPSYASRNDAQNPERVALVTSPWSGGGSFTHSFPPASLTIFRWTVPAP
ncbi:MAG: hypothetical protein IT386_10020 [Deltaproteobacteria bacterium]|nr:hypothetical protein [Deltaproteobacteria bacterium]